MRRMLWLVMLLPFVVAACGDTWRGVRQDTGENLEATGRAVERAGEAVKP
jgi:predicted small secreted protein